MPSLKVASTLITLFLSTFASSQQIVPSSVPESTRDTWCTNQKASCPLLCTQVGSTTATEANTCDPDTLDYSCICSNGIQPNASAFSQTIPYYTCTTFNDQCAANCGSGNNDCVTNCRTAHPCGAQNPPHINATSSTTTASASGSTATGTKASGSAASTDAADATGFFGASATTSTSSSSGNTSGSAPFFRKAETYSLIVVFVSFFAGFSLFL